MPVSKGPVEEPSPRSGSPPDDDRPPVKDRAKLRPRLPPASFSARLRSIFDWRVLCSYLALEPAVDDRFSGDIISRSHSNPLQGFDSTHRRHKTLTVLHDLEN